MEPKLRSTITCPKYNFKDTPELPKDSCQFFTNVLSVNL